MRANTVAISRALAAAVVIVIVLAAGAGIYVYTSMQSQTQGAGSTATSTQTEIVLQIVETDPVKNINNFNPGNITARQGITVMLAVSNHDDAARYFLFPQFNINQTISAGTTQRMSFVADKVGTFTFTSVITDPNNPREKNSTITGNLMVGA
ncbi:MAG: cupredoxin domain-containing protein [Thaumarchaeota archaeon]|nr:cupredoxin domain-containing protein [Nitrososphaerota archaeon]